MTYDEADYTIAVVVRLTLGDINTWFATEAAIDGSALYGQSASDFNDLVTAAQADVVDGGATPTAVFDVSQSTDGVTDGVVVRWRPSRSWGC